MEKWNKNVNRGDTTELQEESDNIMEKENEPPVIKITNDIARKSYWSGLDKIQSLLVTYRYWKRVTKNMDNQGNFIDRIE